MRRIDWLLITLAVALTWMAAQASNVAPSAAPRVAPKSPTNHSEHAPPEQAETWLHQLQMGLDARHQTRPDASTRSAFLEVGPAQSAGNASDFAQQSLFAAAQAFNRPAFQAARDQLQAQALLLDLRFAEHAKRLTEMSAGSEFTQRLQAAHQHVKSTLANQTAQADRLLKNWDLPAAKRYPIAAPDNAADSLILGNNLPVQRLLAAAPSLSNLPAVVPAYASNPAPVPNAADLADSSDAPQHAEISAKAAELGFEYTRILDFVRSSIKTEWYPGSQRGALGALRSRAGNDVDQASLLIALLRASNIPARYVHGVAELSVAELADSLNLQGAPAVLEALNRALRAHRPITQGGVIAAVELELTWVSAHVPFVNYRGAAIADRGRTWLALAPAIKPHTTRPSTQVLRRMAFDGAAFTQSYLTSDPGMAPLARLHAEVTTYLAANPTQGDYATQLSQINPVTEALELLPASLPFKVKHTDFEGAQLPAFLLPQLQVRISNEAGIEQLLHSTPLVDALGQRLTVSFQPATAADQNVINGFGGGLAQVPPYLIQLRPRLTLAGRVLAVGKSMPAAEISAIEISVNIGAQQLQAKQRLTAGGMATIALTSETGAAPPEESGSFVPADIEPLAARVLSNFAHRYARQWQSDGQEIAALLGASIIEPFPAITLALTQMDVERVAGVPTELGLDSIALDAAARAIDVIARDGSAADEQLWFALASLHGSYLEQQIFDQQWAVPAISADRLLARATLAGQSVLTLEGAAGIALLPTLNHSAAVKAEVQRWLNAGMRVRIPSTELAVGAWQGASWVVESNNGSAGYFLTGNIAGGLTLIKPEDWFLSSLAELLSDPYAQAPNLNPVDVFAIRLFTDSDEQIGVVDQMLEIPLRARAEDPTGRPVVGAKVHFTVKSGGGKVSNGGGAGADSVMVQTDRQGMASVNLKLGQRPEFGNYITENEGDYPQFMGLNKVSVRAESQYSAAGVVAGRDYRAYGKPGEVDRIFFTAVPGDGSIAYMIPGLGYGTYRFVVSDEFDNTIANAPLAISVTWEPPFFNTGVVCDTAGAVPPGVFLPEDCPADQLVLTGASCVTSLLNTRSRSGVNTVYLAPTNVMGAFMRLTLASGQFSTQAVAKVMFLSDVATHIAPCSHLEGQAQIAFGHVVHDAYGGLRLTSGRPTPAGATEYSDFWESIEAARPGSWLPVPRRIMLARPSGNGRYPGLAFTGWEIGLPPQSHPYNFGPEMRISAAPGVDIQVAGPVAISEGIYEYNMRMPPTVGKFELLARLMSGVEGIYVSYYLPDVWSVDPQIVSLTPHSVPISPVGTVEADVLVTGVINPPNYTSGELVIEAEKSGIVQSSITMPVGKATFKGVFAHGWSFETDHTYTVKAAINNGTPWRIETERRPIVSQSDTLVGSAVHSGDPADLTDNQAIALSLLRREQVMAQSINITSQRGCTSEGEFLLLLAQRATVTVELYAVDASDSVSPLLSGYLISGEQFEQGLNRHPLNPADIPFGNFEYKVKVTAEDGTEEEVVGRLRHVADRRDHLALGHTLVADVDLWDGETIVSRTDIQLPGRGPTFGVSRTWSSAQGDRLGAFGRGWSTGLESRLELGACTLRVIGGEGSGVEFADPAPGPDGTLVYSALDGYHGSLVKTAAGDFDLYAKDGTRYHYPISTEIVDGAISRKSLQLMFVEDTNGNRVYRQYRQFRDISVVSKLSDSNGREIVFEYIDQASGQASYPQLYPMVKRIVGPLGFDLRFEYDGNGNMISAKREDAPYHETYVSIDLGVVEDTEGRGHRVGWRLQSVKNEIANYFVRQHEFQINWVGYTQQANGSEVLLPGAQVVGVTDELGNETQFDYEGIRGIDTPLETIVTNARNKDSTYTMNTFGGVVKVEDPIGTTLTEWNLPHRQPSKVTDAEAIFTEFSYDNFGNKTRELISGRATPVERTWSYFVPSGFNVTYIKNRVSSLVDFAGDGELMSYDDRGNLRTRTRGGKTEERSYDSSGDLVSHTDFAGNITNFTYNTAGLLVRTIYAGEGQTSQSVDARGRITERKNELNEREIIAYDGLDRVISIKNPDGSERTTEYHDEDLKRIETDELGRETHFIHDRKGRVLKETNPLDDYREWQYDPNGNVLSERNFAGEITTHDYDDGDRRIRSTEPLSRVTKRTFDRTGHLLEQIVGFGVEPRTTRYEYAHPRYFQTRISQLLNSAPLTTEMVVDGEGRVKRRTDPLARVTDYEFDAFGREIKRTEELNRITESNYDGMGRKTSEVVRGAGSASFTRSWTFDERGRELTHTDRTGAVRSKTYDHKGQLRSETDPEARVTQFTYDDRGRVSTQILPGTNRVTTYTYDAVGNLLTELLPSGNLRRHDYDELNRLIKTVDALGTLELREYDPMGRVSKHTDAGGSATDLTYDDLGRLEREDRPLDRDRVLTYALHDEVKTETDGRGFTVTHNYDTLGRRFETIDAIGTQTIAYDEVGNVLSTTDREARITSYTYDALNRRLTQTDPEPPATQQAWTYDALDRVLTHTDRNTIETKFTLDGEGRVRQTERDGRVELQSYDRSGLRITSTDARGAITQYDYDNAGRLTHEKRPLGATWIKTYGPGDEVLSETDADGIVTTYTHDQRLRRETATNAQGITRYEYNNRDQQTAMVRPMGGRWEYDHDEAGRLVSVDGPESGPTVYGYDKSDNRESMTDARGKITSYTHDALGRMRLVTHPDDSTDIYEYDKQGNRTLWIRGDGQRITRDFDGLNRTTEERYAPASSDGLTKLTSMYDGNGNATQVEQHFGSDVATWTATYDNFDRRVSMSDRNGVAITQGYDPNHNRTSRTGPEGQTQFTFNALNQLIELKPPTLPPPVPTPQTTFTVSPAGRLAGMNHSNGTKVEVDRDTVGRVTAIRHLLGSTALLALSYTLDANGNRTEEVWDRDGDRHQITYEYDGADRLSAITSDGQRVQYVLDPVGNRLSESTGAQTKTHGYDDRNRLRTSSVNGTLVETLNYDAAGRQIERIAAGISTTYQYSASDRLLGVRINGAEQVSYQYDAFGQRSGRTAAGQFEAYQFDGTKLAGRTNAVGNSLGDYQHAYSWPISSRENGERSFIHPDTHGTPQLITTATGAIAGWTRTDVWGEEQAQSGIQTRIGYTGYLKDPLIDELYAQARQYRPGTGRFTTVDEWAGDVNYPVSMNKYLGFNGNPTVYLDPDGRIAFLSDAERYLRDTMKGYEASIDQAVNDGAGGRAFALGLGKGLVLAGNAVVGGLNTTSNLLAQNIYDGGTYAQARSELDANEMAVSAGIEGADNLGQAVWADPIGSVEKARQATVRFSVDAAMGEAQAWAGIGEFTGGVLAAPGGAFAIRGSGRLAAGASELAGSARAAGRLELGPKQLVEGSDGSIVERFHASLADDLNEIERPAGRGTDIVDTKRAVENLTQRAITEIAEKPSIAKSLMTPGSYRHLANRSALAAASYGKAVERLVARYIGQDWRLARALSHTGITKGARGRFTRSPDFIGKEAYDLRLIDITTEKDLAKHLARPSGPDTDHVTYPGLPPELEFPN